MTARTDRVQILRCRALGAYGARERRWEPAGRQNPPEGIAEILFIGSATLLIRCGPVTPLTDPDFLRRGQFAHLGYGLRSRRLHR